MPWTSAELAWLLTRHELEIAAPRSDGTRGRWTPIWVVVVAHRVFVRTWQRRTTGWYGGAVASGRLWIHLDGQVVEVAVARVGDEEADAVDAAYRAKYGAAGSRSMVTTEPRLSTLRLDRAG